MVALDDCIRTCYITFDFVKSLKQEVSDAYWLFVRRRSVELKTHSIGIKALITLHGFIREQKKGVN